MENVQISLIDLKRMQDEYELAVYKKYGIDTYPASETKLALLVELGELANEVKSFKYWKNPDNCTIDNDKLREEFADCLHFALSVEDITDIAAMSVSDEKFVSIIDDPESDVTINDLFNTTFFNVTTNNQILLSVIYLGMSLGLTMNDIVKEYVKKNKINYERLESNY